VLQSKQWLRAPPPLPPGRLHQIELAAEDIVTEVEERYGGMTAALESGEARCRCRQMP
jgi:hypothetical protein